MNAFSNLRCRLSLIASLIFAACVQAAPTELSNSPLSGASSVEINPNVIFILDDSTSMKEEQMPDWAKNRPLWQEKNPKFNGIYYNPAITYTAPKYFTAGGAADTTTYPSQTSAGTSGWTQVKDDGYGVQSTALVGLAGFAHYYTTVVGEYCTNKSLKTCVAATAPTATHPEPAPLRWCSSAAEAGAATPSAGACQATQIQSTGTNIPFEYPRLPHPRVSTFTVSGASSTSVSGITVNGQQILAAGVAATTSPSTLAAGISDQINACTLGLSGACQVVGFRAETSGATVTIFAPAAITHTPAVTKSGTMTVTPTAFAKPASNQAPGEIVMTVITDPSSTYPKDARRSDCAGATTCTYAEEMTNYANWYAYYRTRMQMMKTASSTAFEPIGSSFRVGLMSINNNTGSDFLNITNFDATQKKAWYDKLFAAKIEPSAGVIAQTPLRVALSDAGRLYANKLGNTFRGISVVDPVQHYCQQNVSMLSTDGYWNQGAGYTVAGSGNPVGNQDGPEVIPAVIRPQLDAGGPQDQLLTLQDRKMLTPTTATWLQKKTEQVQTRNALVETRTYTLTQERTSTLQERNAQRQRKDYKLQSRSNTVPLTSTLTQLQEQTMPLQIRTGPLRSRTGQLQTRTKTQTQEKVSVLQYQSGQRQSKTYQLQRRYTTQVQQRTSSNGGASWSGWSSVDSCTTASSGTNRVQCQTISGPGSWSDVSSCSVVPYGSVTSGGSDGGSTTYTTGYECQYTSPSWVNTASCSVVAKSTSSPYTVGTAVDCQTVWSGTWVNATSTCTTGEAMQCQYTAWPGSWTNVASCSTQTQSAASPFTVLTARQCQTNQWTPWADTSSTCNSSTTVGCQYSWSGWSNDATCSATPASTGNPYSVISAKECAVNWGSWTNTTTCNQNLSGGTQTQCQYSGTWSGWSDVGSCSTKTPDTGPSFTGPARNCQTVWTTPVAAGPCVNNATTTCTSTWSAWADVPSPGGCTATSTGGAGGTGTVECRYRLLADWYNVASCTTVTQSTHPNYTNNVANDCQSTWPTGWVNATASCVPETDIKECRYSPSTWTGWATVGSCSAQPKSTASPYSVLTARECQTEWTNWSTTASCTEVAGSTDCRVTWPNPWVGNGSASCTPSAYKECRTALTSDWSPSLPTNTTNDPPLTSSGITCAGGTVGDVITSCRNEIPPPTGWLATENCSTGSYVDANGNTIDRTCKIWTNGVPDNDGAAPVDVATCSEDPGTSAPYIQKICTVRARGQTPDTLADVAQYYWKTDLRDTGLGNCTGGPVTSGGITTNNNVCTNDATYDRQYMTTYTLGLGASGLMQYQSDYQTAGSGDFYSVKTGATADSATGVCSWQKNGVCNWPMPAADSQANIDDLWHAAVNGRGSYFSAADPSAVAAGISSALASITVKEGALTAVTVTSPNLVAGDNGVFELSFKAGEWSGDLVKRTIDGTTGALSATATWSAKTLLDAKISGTGHTSRKIFTFNPGGESASGLGDNLKPFLWVNLTTAEQDYFVKPAINSLSQFCTIGTTCLSAANQTSASGENLVNFLRGDKSNEGPQADLAKFYRQRVHALGDIVGSEAVYVQQSPWQYADYKYFDFKTSNASRTGMVYVGSNDGMLHAFNSTTGQEVWAYVPKIVMPNLYQLADKAYAGPGFHRFFVDGSPAMGDICTSACTTPESGTGSPVWKTILVGGLNKGGRGYYALDITDPAAPKALWEFTDDNLGYSYGNPVITKIDNPDYPSSSTDKEKWVVIFSSGYNNYGPGDGAGRLFIVNADTGTLIRSISTGVGNTTTPSGLGRITAWANYPNYNNFAKRVYGGDLLGNLWRFDVNGDIPAPAEGDPRVYDAQRLATLKDAGGVAQPITSRPELGKVKDHPVVFVATGQLLGSADLSTTQRQSVYAIKDRLTNEDYGSPRPQTPAQTTPTPGQFVNQSPTNTTLLGAPLTCSTDDADATDGDGGYCVAGEGIVKSTADAVDFNVKDGWYMDFPVNGERVNTDLRLVQGTLAFNTNTPQVGACVPIGVSYAYFLDYRTGGYVEGSNGLIGVRLGSYLSSAPSIIRLEDGTIKELVRTDSATTIVKEVPTAPTLFSTRRISWRELITGQ